MKIACFPNSYGRFGPDAAIEHLPHAGIRWLELPIKNEGVPSFFKETPVLTDASSSAEIEAVQTRINDAGLQVCSCNISSGNPLDGDVVERTLQKLKIAAQFGVRLVVAGGGEIEHAEQWGTLAANLTRIADVASELGITYCCETHPGVCQNAERMLELIDRVPHQHLRLNFDTGNIFYYNEHADLMNELQAALPFVEHVHLKDTNGAFQQWHFPAFGDGGAVDFRQVRELLETHQFAGPCSLEIEGISGEPELTLAQTQQRIIDSVAHLKRCGFQFV